MYDQVYSRVRCTKYIIRYVTEGYPSSIHLDYTVVPVEGDLVHAEIHTSHSFDIKEFVVGASTYNMSQIFDTHGEAEIAAKKRIRNDYEKTKSLLERFNLA
ncbi:hypothetical protein EVB64_194 [Rhizobium phage RHph_TM61]|nr:hypothetical protein EVB64_194 [Rhizobium phage RHph_TM61]